MNYVNYAKHSLFSPDTYHRRYDLDLQDERITEIARRIGETALPFIALYKPAGMVLSVGLGAGRCLSHVLSAFSYQQKQEWLNTGGELALCAISASVLAATFSQFTLGLALSTGVDVVQGLYRTLDGLSLEEGMQTTASCLYLGFMVIGGLEWILFSTCMQVLISLYQSKKEMQKGHYIEALGKGLFAGIKGYQAYQYQKMIQYQEMLYAMKKYQGLVASANRAKMVRHLVNHPFVHLEQSAKERAVHLQGPLHEYDLGAHLHSFGGGLVKGCNLQIQQTNQGWELEFKLNHCFREKLKQKLEELSYFPSREIQDILKFAGFNEGILSIENEGLMTTLIDFYGSDGKAPVQKISVQGIGSVYVGNHVVSEGELQGVPNLYNQVVVKMAPGKTLYDLHALLAFLDLDRAILPCSQEELDRLKLGHLFHTLFPRESLQLERDVGFFEMPLETLKKVMIEKVPRMQEIYDRYWDKIEAKEIVPGRIRYQIKGLAEEVKAKEMACLTSAVTGNQDEKSLFARIESMLSMGMISTEWRDRYRIGNAGLSRWKDYSAGGADSVFMQLLPETVLNGKRSFEDWSVYESKIHLLVSLDEVEGGTYQYLRCGIGNRIRDWDPDLDDDDWEFFDRERAYRYRLNILDFADKLRAVVENDLSYYRTHEVMVKERIAPNAIQGMVVESESLKQSLLSHLRAKGYVAKDTEGQETILGIAVDRFIRTLPLSTTKK